MANLASGGFLFYTASFAAFESGVIILVLAWQVKEYFHKKSDERDKALLNRGAAIGAEADRQRQDTGETREQAIARLIIEGWEPEMS